LFKDQLEVFTVEDVNRQQWQQHAENLFAILCDVPLQAHHDDLDRTYLTLKDRVHVGLTLSIICCNLFIHIYVLGE
jgi:hypothetical protein